METDLCGLPPDCLRLILSKVDYGRNKQAVWALSGSCKTVQQAMKECPADVTLDSTWQAHELLGICAALPKMASLAVSRSVGGLCCENCLANKSARDCLQKDPNPSLKQFLLWLSGSSLTRLDLGLQDFCQTVEGSIPEYLQEVQYIPERLEHLCLPNVAYLSIMAAGDIHRLAGLTHLEWNEFEPALVPFGFPVGLQSLCLCGYIEKGTGYLEDRAGYDEGAVYARALSRLTNLTSLELGLDTLVGVTFPSTLQNLNVNDYIEESRMLSAALLDVATRLTRLTIFKSTPRGQDVLDLRNLSWSKLREVSATQALPHIIAPHPTSLRFKGRVVDGYYTDCWLRAEAIKRISAMTTIRQLEISSWKKWDDLRPLACLPLLTRLESIMGLPLLWHMLKPGCLQSLQMVTLAGHFIPMDADDTLIAAVEMRLLALPRFRLLAKPSKWGEYDTRHDADPVEELVGLHRDKWKCLLSKGHCRLYERV